MSESSRTIAGSTAYMKVEGKRGEDICDLGKEYLFTVKTLRQK